MIRVGLVGASADARWAAEAHVPALRALDGFVLQAVATRSEASAAASAERHGAPLAFAGGEALAAHPDVDLVSICVKVPDHAAVVRAALAAGKHVLCEWPLAVDRAEADDLTALARDAGVVAAVGLQARAAPVVRHAAELVRDGYVGRLDAATLLVSAGAPGGARVPQAIAFGLDRAAGMNALTVPTGHALDALCVCAGDPEALSAEVATRHADVTVIETGEALRASAPDHVAVAGRLRGGALLAVQAHGGAPAGVGARIELRGSEGVLRIDVRGRHLQNSPLELHGARAGGAIERLDVPERLWADIPPAVRDGVAGNVAGVYAAVGRAIRGEEPPLADFAAAARHHGVLEAIERAAVSGRRERLPGAAAPR